MPRKTVYYDAAGKGHDTPIGEDGKPLRSAVGEKILKQVAAHGKGRGKK
jgi:hypothetical protein